MIKPDRLKELIEQKAMIYGITGLPCWIEEIDLGSLLYEQIGNRLYKVDIICYGSEENDFRKERLYRFNDEDLFETKEEADWYLEFGNITREEKLVLPSWEEFKENCNFPTIHCKNGKTANFTVSNSYLEIYKDSDDGYCEKKIYGKPLTKENYIDACKLCKQLFLGEKV